MILVDTSIWIEFLRVGNETLTQQLEQGHIVTHPIIIGELSCGNISKRNQFLGHLQDLPQAAQASHDETKAFIDRHKTFGKGVGYLDHMILCSAIISDLPLWTLDKKLHHYAQLFGKVP